MARASNESATRSAGWRARASVHAAPSAPAAPTHLGLDNGANVLEDRRQLLGVKLARQVAHDDAVLVHRPVARARLARDAHLRTRAKKKRGAGGAEVRWAKKAAAAARAKGEAARAGSTPTTTKSLAHLLSERLGRLDGERAARQLAAVERRHRLRRKSGEVGGGGGTARTRVRRGGAWARGARTLAASSALAYVMCANPRWRSKEATEPTDAASAVTARKGKRGSGVCGCVAGRHCARARAGAPRRAHAPSASVASRASPPK